MNIFDDLVWRGLVAQHTPGVRSLLEHRPIPVYMGFDPTASSLHVGHLLGIIALVRLQRTGHRPICVVGGATGLIGDPSGKRQERPMLRPEEVGSNLEAIRDQLGRFLDFETKKNPAIILNNHDWLADFRLIDFLRDVGKSFQVKSMLRKESVRKRIQVEGGFSFTEFSYMLLQSYDFLFLLRQYDCLLQIGGADQWGNITAGIDFIRRTTGRQTHGLVLPLITTANGGKFGKTESGSVWLDPNLTSPFRFYQFWLNTPDDRAVQYLKFFTLVDEAEIAELERATSERPGRREAQMMLTREVTRMVHGADSLAGAERASRALFNGDFSKFTGDEILDVFGDFPSFVLEPGRLAAPLPLVELLVEAGLASSGGDARRLILADAVRINDRRCLGVDAYVDVSDLIQRRFFVLRKGRRECRLVQLALS